MKKKVLIIQTAFIGDVILATSFIEAIKKAIPESEVHFVLRKGNEVLLQDNPFIKELFIWDKNKNKKRNLLSLITQLRKNHYHYAFNIQRFFSTGLIMSLIKAHYKIGFDKNPLSFFYTHKVKHQIPYLKGKNIIHEVDRNLELIKAVGYEVPTQKPKLYLDKVSLFSAKKPYIVMAPTSVWFTKGWPLTKWSELTEKLKNYTVYLVGAPQDKESCELVKGGQEHVINLAGKLSLIESAKLMEQASRVIANDSAALHLASAVNAPSTAIFCSTTPDFGYGPLSDDQMIIEVKEDLPCKPCGLHGKKNCPLKHFNCAYEIEVDRVRETI